MSTSIFHLSFKSNGDVHYLNFFLNQLKRRKGSKQALDRRKVDKSPKTWEETNQRGGQNVQGIFCHP
jgi:hypothetical protein